MYPVPCLPVTCFSSTAQYPLYLLSPLSYCLPFCAGVEDSCKNARRNLHQHDCAHACDVLVVQVCAAFAAPWLRGLAILHGLTWQWTGWHARAFMFACVAEDAAAESLQPSSRRAICVKMIRSSLSYLQPFPQKYSKAVFVLLLCCGACVSKRNK